MKIIDLWGELNEHSKYLEVLKLLERKCDHIEIVGGIINRHELVKTLDEDIIYKRIVKTWWGTQILGLIPINKMYGVKSSKLLFRELKKYETFCKYYSKKGGDHSETTNFGNDDIAFFDKEKEPLLYTVTHEGYIRIREDVYKDLIC